MTDTTAYSYPRSASPLLQDAAASPGPILMWVAGPVPLRRATVAVRLLLVIPQLLACYLLGIAAAFVVVIGWLGALVTGRLPRFAAIYLAPYLRWYATVGAYLLFLIDEYPPLMPGAAVYPLRLAVSPGKLNRLTVLFRGILAIPVAIVCLLLTPGLAVAVILIGWPAALIAGRLPASLHQAFAAVLRFGIRCNGYVYLLTGAYPAGLFGDEPGSLVPGTGAAGEDAGWRLPLSRGAKRLVGLLLVVGLLAAAGGGAWAGATISAARQRDREISQLRVEVARFNATVAQHNAAVTRVRQATSLAMKASQTLTSAHDALASALHSKSADPTGCATVSCINVASQFVVKGFAAFGRTLHGTAIPPGSAAIARRLSAATAATERYWVAITKDTSGAAIQSDATAAGKTGFDSDYEALSTSLDNDLTPLGNQALTLDAAAITLNHEGAALSRRATALNVTVSVRIADPGTVP
jgi:hypothetical protein